MADHKTKHELCGRESITGDKCVLYKNHISEECQTNHGRKKWKTFVNEVVEEAKSVYDDMDALIAKNEALVKQVELLEKQVSILRKGGSIA